MAESTDKTEIGPIRRPSFIFREIWRRRNNRRVCEESDRREAQGPTVIKIKLVFYCIVFFGLLIPLCYFGWRPTTHYLAANSHLNESDHDVPNFMEFTDRQPLLCETNLTIGMVSNSNLKSDYTSYAFEV